jgi:G3E family GTPase
MTDLPPALREALMGGDQGISPTQYNIAVAELLVSQTETADVVILNKVDLIDNKEELETIDQIVVALNPKARVDQTSFGKVSFSKVLAVAAGKGVVEAGVVDDHRDAVQAAEQHLSSQHHSHEHKHHSEHTDRSEQAQQHNHAHSSEASIGGADCAVPDCTDASHSHDHGHSHSDAATLHQLGIGSFVYRARKPFHPQRLTAFLRHMPISRGLPETSDEEPLLKITQETKDALQRVVRSKGFVWTADSNVAANYWSHAGTSFEMPCLGRWWATLPRREVCTFLYSEPTGLILFDDFLV